MKQYEGTRIGKVLGTSDAELEQTFKCHMLKEWNCLLRKGDDQETCISIIIEWYTRKTITLYQAFILLKVFGNVQPRNVLPI